jgi:DNA/RNA endonuclease G (NUC1)
MCLHPNIKITMRIELKIQTFPLKKMASRFLYISMLLTSSSFLRTRFVSNSHCEDDATRRHVANIDEIREPCIDDLIIRSASWGNRQACVKWMLKYDTRTRAPKWAFERLTPQDKDPYVLTSKGQFSRKNSSFKEDSRITALTSRTKPDDFKGSGYDRGHMVPAGDCQQSQQAIDESFTMANICPQDSVLNKGFWSSFESWVRYLVNKYDVVEVITGPVYAPIFDKNLNKWAYHFDITGTYPRHICVPTHFFKIIKARKSASVRRGGKSDDTLVAVGAFLIENSSIDRQTPISNFAVRIEDIEVVTGIRFFDESLNVPARLFLDNCVPEAQRDISQMLNRDNSIRDNSNVSSSIDKKTKDSNKKVGQLFGKCDKYHGDRESADIDTIVRIVHLCQAENCSKPFHPTCSKQKGGYD